MFAPDKFTSTEESQACIEDKVSCVSFVYPNAKRIRQ